MLVNLLQEQINCFLPKKSAKVDYSNDEKRTDRMKNNAKLGITYALIAYLIWGVLPIYWKFVDDTRPDAVLAHRIIWSFVFILIIILLSKNFSTFLKECKRILFDKKTFFIILSASILISLNWLIFIWAVQNNYVVQSSLGYYINPLMNVVLGLIFFKEVLSKAQTTAVVLAAIGVLYLTFSYGVFPWVSLALATTFAIYGVLKKIVNINPMFSLAIETLFVTPLALIYLVYLFGPTLGFNSQPASLNGLLMFAGIATAIPLLLFGTAVQQISLSLVGFLQYIAPTLMLLIGVFLYNEPFTQAHLVAFTFIWAALVLYMVSSFKPKRKLRA